MLFPTIKITVDRKTKTIGDSINHKYYTNNFNLSYLNVAIQYTIIDAQGLSHQYNHTISYEENYAIKTKSSIKTVRILQSILADWDSGENESKIKIKHLGFDKSEV